MLSYKDCNKKVPESSDISDASVNHGGRRSGQEGEEEERRREEGEQNVLHMKLSSSSSFESEEPNKCMAGSAGGLKLFQLLIRGWKVHETSTKTSPLMLKNPFFNINYDPLGKSFNAKMRFSPFRRLGRLFKNESVAVEPVKRKLQLAVCLPLTLFWLSLRRIQYLNTKYCLVCSIPSAHTCPPSLFSPRVNSTRPLSNHTYTSIVESVYYSGRQWIK